MKKVSFFSVILLIAFTGLFTMAADKPVNQDPIPQGDFAALFCDHLNTPRPAGGWTPALAIPFLEGLKIVPTAGKWEAGATLVEKDMVFMLREMGISVYSPQPESVVTYAKANAVFQRYDDYLYNWNLKTRTVMGSTTTHIDSGVGQTDVGAPPASPTKIND